MTGEKKIGLYRIIQDQEIHFYRVRPDDQGDLISVELEHVDGTAREMKDTKRPLSDEMWERLVTWQ